MHIMARYALINPWIWVISTKNKMRDTAKLAGVKNEGADYCLLIMPWNKMLNIPEWLSQIPEQMVGGSLSLK